MERCVTMQEHTSRAALIDPITLEVIRHRLVSIANQIDANIKRTAFSPYIYEYNDFAVGLSGADGQLIAQCTGGVAPPLPRPVGLAGGGRRWVVRGAGGGSRG